MAYDRDKIFEQAKKVIVTKKLYFIEDIVAYLPISKKSFYEFYPVESDECNELKELLEVNKVNTKVAIRKKLQKGDKAAELISLYKLICSEDERKALSMQQVEHSGTIIIDWTND
jgi:hypothetical protein